MRIIRGYPLEHGKYKSGERAPNAQEEPQSSLRRPGGHKVCIASATRILLCGVELDRSLISPGLSSFHGKPNSPQGVALSQLPFLDEKEKRRNKEIGNRFIAFCSSFQVARKS